MGADSLLNVPIFESNIDRLTALPHKTIRLNHYTRLPFGFDPKARYGPESHHVVSSKVMHRGFTR
jgi:hypothetical protein